MEEIGHKLQAARLAKGLTLQNVEDETRIRKKYIEALENGRTAVIPGEVYVKGFLRTYGNHLGLDGEGLVEQYKALHGAKEGDGTNGERLGTGKATQTAAASVEEPAAKPERHAARVAGPGDMPPRRPSPRPRGSDRSDPSKYLARRALVVLVVAVPLIAFGWWLFGVLTPTPRSLPPATVEQKDPPPAAKEPKPAPPPPAPEPAKPTVTMTGPTGESVAFAVSVSPVVVELQGFREGFPWMEATVDGKVVFSGKPTAPVKYQGKQISLRVGFMVGVDMVVNGQKFAEPLKGGPYTIKLTGK